MSEGCMMETGLRTAIRAERALSPTAGSDAMHFEPAGANTLLVGLVESQIIPQLLAADRPLGIGKGRSMPGEMRPSFANIGGSDLAEFAQLLLQDDMLAVASFIEMWRAKGMSVETIYLELLTGAARHLGEMWSSDDCNFCEVGCAVWRIQQVMYDLRPAFFAEGAAVTPSGYRVLLAPIASEQHTLGVMMSAEFFRRAGWDVSSELPVDNEALAEAVSREHIDLLGLSVSSQAALEQLPSVLVAIRKASRNQKLTVMVGGWMFADNPNKLIAGADFCVSSVRDALIKGKRYVSRATCGGHAIVA
ncbi:MAG: B12-binding domain-containing protein [Burkholderiales bacterium]